MIPDDQTLINEIKDTGDENALLELIDRHSGIYHKTLTQFLPYSYSDFEKKDEHDNKDSAIFEAVESFDDTRGVKFSTWLATRTRYNCLTKREKEKKNIAKAIYTARSISEDKENNGENDLDDQEGSELSPDLYLNLKDQAAFLINYLKEEVGDNTSFIVKERFFGGAKKVGRSFVDIANELEISPQAVHSTFHKSMNKLKQQFCN